jgi:tetratricopeptide (TPR) repeat protein
LPPFAFAVPELTDEELELFGLADQQAYASPPASPTPAPAPSAEADQGATGGEPDRQEATHEPPPVEADTTQKLLAFDDFDLGAYEQVAFEESHTLPAGAQSTQTPAPAAAPVSADLREIYAQLEVQPDNHALRLAVARLSEQKGDIERALEQYRQLIKRNALLDPVIEDLQDLAGGEYDHALLRRVHRLLGDAYIKQDRLQEALAQYSWI